MKIKANDELVLKKDCFIGKKGYVFNVENVTDEYVTVKRETEHKTATATFTHNYIDDLFDIVKKEEPKYKEIEIDFDDLINKIIENSEVKTDWLFGNCFVMSVVLPNGYVITESHTFNELDERDKEIAYDICITNIYEKVLELENYATMYPSNVEILFAEDNDCANCPDVDDCPYV